MPGIAASTSETWLLGSPPKAVEAPENSFAREVTCAWTSSPTMTSQSAVAPLINFELAAVADISLSFVNDGVCVKPTSAAIKRVPARPLRHAVMRAARASPRLDESADPTHGLPELVDAHAEQEQDE